MFHRTLLIALGSLVLAGPATGQALFTDVSESSGLGGTQGFHHAIALADYDGDGRLDIYVGTRLGVNRLFRNLGNMEFQEVGAAAGVADPGNTMSAIWVDVDNDGDPDLATGNSNSANRMYLNNGNGTFTDVTDDWGMGVLSTTRSLNAADVNGDGWVDLYCSNLSAQNVLWLNQQGTGFANATFASGALDMGVAMGSIFLDVDNDGDQDLYLTHDANQTNLLYLNNGSGQFTSAGVAAGLNYQGNCMGVDAADVNHDGFLDLYISNLYPSELFLSNGDGTFNAVGEAAGVDDTGMTWGTSFFDYNQDGLHDLYIANDYLFSPAPNILYRGEADGTFTVVSAGDAVLEHPYSDNGMAMGDLDGDGDLDVVIATHGNSGQPGPTILRNDAATGHRLTLQLEGTTSNRDAIGARATAYYNGVARIAEVHCGRGYSGGAPLALHWGLGDAEVVDSVHIRWPSGVESTHGPWVADSTYAIVEPGGLPWFYSGCTNDGACNYVPAAVEDDGSCVYPLLGEDCEGNLIDEGISTATHSVARVWNEVVLHGVRHDWARPTIHARNLWHSSMLMYDAWVAWEPDTLGAPAPYFLGDTVAGFACPFEGVPDLATPEERRAAQEATISYGVARLTQHRFALAPQAEVVLAEVENRMADLGYDLALTSTDYTTGDLAHDAAALGNYLADQIIDFGLQDGAHESLGYANTYYNPINWYLVMDEPGNGNLDHPNRWQPLQLAEFIDQSGNPASGSNLDFLSPEWGDVVPFSLQPEDVSVFERYGSQYQVYHDPGPPPYIDPELPAELDSDYKWGHTMVAVWSSHLDPADSVMWDISPGALGRMGDYPTSFDEARDFYQFHDGGVLEGPGHAFNPATGEPYAPQVVPRGDYARVLAEFWADGPDSETPPGHWFTVMNHANDLPEMERRWRGVGPVIDTLAWDVMGYFALGGAMHDAAISAWSVKGWYDYVRPVSALRWMADQGQSSDPEGPNYSPAGIPLIPGVIELITDADPIELTGEDGAWIDKPKVRSWRGPYAVEIPATDMAGVGWIRLAEWWPYQRPTFVTPPFAGYVSGHSTYSRAAAEVLTLMTGDAFFPGGMGVFPVEANEFLVFEDGPSVSFELQWATYRDAADQSALSRIWGGIHPPQDDFPGRAIGEAVGIEAFLCAETFARPLAGWSGGEDDMLGSCPGDFNGDGLRAIADLLVLLMEFSSGTAGGSSPADLTGDGICSTSDLMAFLAVWGLPCD